MLVKPNAHNKRLMFFSYSLFYVKAEGGGASAGMSACCWHSLGWLGFMVVKVARRLHGEVHGGKASCRLERGIQNGEHARVSQLSATQHIRTSPEVSKQLPRDLTLHTPPLSYSCKQHTTEDTPWNNPQIHTLSHHPARSYTPWDRYPAP